MTRSPKKREFFETMAGWMRLVDTSTQHAFLDSLVTGLEAWYRMFPDETPLVKMPESIPPAYRWMADQYLSHLVTPVQMETCPGSGAIWLIKPHPEVREGAD